MPLHVKVFINERKIEELHIGRWTGDTNPNSINTYLAVLGSEPLRVKDWEELGTPFAHRYGDGALVCVKNALETLVMEGVGIPDKLRENNE